MKKILSIILSVLMMFLSTVPNVYGEVIDTDIKNYKFIEKHEEITDINILLNNENEKDSKTKVEKSIHYEGLNKVTTIKVNQLLSKKQDVKGSVFEDYVATTNTIIEPMSSGSKEESAPDTSYSCTLSVKIYYTRTTINGRPLVYLTKVSGGVTEPSPLRIDVSGAVVEFAQSGIGMGGFYDQSEAYNVISQIGSGAGNFYVLIPGDWEPVGDNSTSLVGATFYVTLIIPNTSNSWLSSVQVLLY